MITINYHYNLYLIGGMGAKPPQPHIFRCAKITYIPRGYAILQIADLEYALS